MRASEFAEDMFGVEKRRATREGARPTRGHKPVERYHKVKEDSGEFVVFEIDSEHAFEKVMDKFGDVIEWNGDYMVAPRKFWSNIEITAFEAGGSAEEITDEQLNELNFLGSQCTKDCSGHRAGYAWFKQNGYEPASWSDSFNKGAALANAGR